MGKLSSILLGTVSGAALALFLTSDKGKQICSQAQDFLDDLREDPEFDQAKSCARQATEASKETFNNLKEQWQEQSTTPDVAEDQEEIIIDITEV